MTTKAERNIEAFIEKMNQITYRLVTVSENKEIKGMASGFLYQPTTITPIFITAGHKLSNGGLFIETKVTKNNTPILLNAGTFEIFYDKKTDIDYAYSKLPLELYTEETSQKACLSLQCYQHDSFYDIDKKEPYGFSVTNNFNLVKNDSKLIMDIYSCFEIGLTLVKQSEHINYFKTIDRHKGDDFYRGASGSPIANSEGAINSILIGGDEEGLLKGFRLDNITF
jgi:hypothetical protein